MYELVIELTRDIYGWVDDWPAPHKEKVGDQLVRAIESVGAHLAEAGGHSTVANRRRVLSNACSELDETAHWLMIGEMKNLLAPGTENRTAEIERMLNGLIKNPGRR